MAVSAQQVISTYQQFLGRTPSQSEVQWQVANANPGNFVTSVQNSPEAKARTATPAPSAPAMPPSNDNAEYTNAVAQSNAAFQSLIDSQNKQQQGLFDTYTNTANSQEKLPVLYDRLSTELGIPDLSNVVKGYKDQILSVQQLLGNLPMNVNERNKGTFTTQAQADRQIAAEGDPLRRDLTQLGYALAPTAEALSGAQGTLGTMLNLNVQQQTKDLHPLELQISAIGDRFAREITGFTSMKEDTLNALMDKIQRNRELSDAEWKNAQDLAAAETEFQHQKELIAAKAGAGGGGINLPTGTGGGAGASGPTMSQKSSIMGGGYNFTNASGQPISAATYAKLIGSTPENVFKVMANNGDATAASAYNWLRSISGSEAYKTGAYKNSPAYQNYSSLFWGS